MKVELIKQILMVGFSSILDDKRQINRWKNIVSRFRSKLIKMNKDVNCKFDDDSISPKIRQVLLHWGNELTEKGFFY